MKTATRKTTTKTKVQDQQTMAPEPEVAEVQSVKEITPVVAKDFQMSMHRYTQFDCTVPSGLTKADLENPALWVNIAPRLRQRDEIRAMPEDQSFVAYLIVLFSQGSDVRVKVTHGTDLETIADSASMTGLYDIKPGLHGFTIFNTKTGEEIKTSIPTRKQAFNDMEDHERAMRR